MKALIAISVSRQWTETDFLCQMGTWRLPVEWQVKFGWFKQFTAEERHNVAALEALYNYDRLIFMDTDQVYPPDYVEMMLEHKEPVVTGLNVARYHPFDLTIYRHVDDKSIEGIEYPFFETMDMPAERISECDFAGTGAMSIDPEVFKELREPYFKDIHAKDGALRLLCDDFYFCWQLHKKGIKVTVDRSIVVKHNFTMSVSPYNRTEVKRAWEKINTGHGYAKDGKQP